LLCCKRHFFFFYPLLGVTDGVLYTDKEWERELLKKHGRFDVIIDSAGGPDFDKLMFLLQNGGTIVSYGATAGRPPPFNIHKLFLANCSILGSTMCSDKDFAEMLAFVLKHKIVPLVDSVRELKDALSALSDMSAGKQFGKIVLRVKDAERAKL